MSVETMKSVPDKSEPPGAPPPRTTNIRGALERFGLLIVLFALIGIFTLVLPGTFFTSVNLTVTLSAQAAILMLALAVTLPLRAGDFDLSVGMVMIGTASVIGVLTTQQGWALGPAVAVALVLAMGIGLLNAALIVGLGIDAFIVTLGTMTWLAGVITAFTGGDVITGIPAALGDLANTEVLGSIPSRVFIGWGLALLLWYVYEYTRFGRRLLFTGGNRDAARLSGIKVGRIRTAAFVSAALISACAGILLAGALGAVDPTSGHAYLLQPYAAAFLGTTVIQFRRFNAIGTVVGVYLLAVGVSGLQLLGVEAWVSDVFNGAVLVIAVALATLMRRESIVKDMRAALRRLRAGAADRFTRHPHSER
jgi:ribose transport system permease protein